MQGPQLPRRCEANAVRTPPVRTKPLLSSLTPSDGNVEICCSEILRLVYTERNEGPGGRCLKTTCGDNNHHQLDTNGSLRIGPRCSGSNLMKIGEDCEHLEQHINVTEHTDQRGRHRGTHN
jgi:hypothetical protein